MFKKPHSFRVYTEIQCFSPVKAEINSVRSFQREKNIVKNPGPRFVLSVSLGGSFYSRYCVQDMPPTDHALLQESWQSHLTRKKSLSLNRQIAEITGSCPKVVMRRMNQARRKLQLVRSPVISLPPLPRLPRDVFFPTRKKASPPDFQRLAYLPLVLSPRIQAKLGKKLALPVKLAEHSARFETSGLVRVGRIRCTTSSSSGSRRKNPSGRK